MDFLFRDYLIDYNRFKNILLTCDWFLRIYSHASEVYAKVHLLAIAGQ